MTKNRTLIAGSLIWQLLRVRLSGASDKQQQTRRLLFDNFRHLGGIYIKFLQMLTMNIGFLKGWGGPSEFDIFEAAPFEPIDLNCLLASELPGHNQHFTSIEMTPFAAGSFAQVYRATLANGSLAIVKVLRPSLARHLKSDLRVLGLITRLSGWLFPSSTIDINQMFKQFSATVIGETDYRREVRNAQWFYDYFKSSPKIVIPKTYAELSTSSIIVQEYMDGLSLSEVLQSRQQGQEPSGFVASRLGSNIWQQLQTLGTEILVAAVTADFVIGDPHPGNIKLLSGDRVGLIDFGVAAPSPPNRQSLLGMICEYEKVYANNFDPSNFTLATLNFFDEDLTSALAVVGQRITPEDPYSILKTIGQSATSALNNPATRAYNANLIQGGKMARLFSQSINQNNRFGVKFNTESTSMLKSAVTYLLLVENIGQKQPVVYNAIKQALVTIDNNPSLAAMAAPRTPAFEQALETLGVWLEKVADNDPFLYQQLTGSIAV